MNDIEIRLPLKHAFFFDESLEKSKPHTLTYILCIFFEKKSSTTFDIMLVNLRKPIINAHEFISIENGVGVVCFDTHTYETNLFCLNKI